MKKYLLPALGMIMVLVLAACGGGSGPEKTVDNFMKSYKDLKIQEASEHLATELEEEYVEILEEESGDMNIEDIEELDNYKAFEDSFKKLTKMSKYEIVETSVDGDNAKVEIKFTYADAGEPLLNSLGEVLGQMFGMAFTMGDIDEDEANEKIMEMTLETIVKNLEGHEAEIKEAQGIITLTKENDDWIITEFDDEIGNGLLFGLTEAMKDYNPFIFDGEPIDKEFEVDFEDVEIEEDNK